MLHYKEKRLASCKAHIRTYDNGAIVLQSYATDVILMTPKGWAICTGTYSSTTRSHISRFMRDHAPGNGDYFTMKEAYESSHVINLTTGETREFSYEVRWILERHRLHRTLPVERLCAILDGEVV